MGVLELVIVLVALYAVFAIMLPFLRPGRLLAGIARLVAARRPTGSLTMTTCRSCELSPVRKVGVIGIMPHELVHSVVQELEPHITALFHQLCGEQEWAAGRVPEEGTPIVRAVAARLWRHAEDQVVAEVSAVCSDLERLWEVNVEPRLRAYTDYGVGEIAER